MENMSPKEKFEFIKTQIEREKSIRQIEEETGIPISTIHHISSAVKKGFKSQAELQDYYARQRVNPETGERFKSRGELNDYYARQRVNPETGERFKSSGELQDYYARQRVNPETGERFKSQAELRDYYARQKEYVSMSHFVSVRNEIRKPSSKLTEKLLSDDEIITLEALGRIQHPRDYIPKFNEDALSLVYEAINNLKSQRQKEVLHGLFEGKNLSQIGKKHGISREATGIHKNNGISNVKYLLGIENSQNPDTTPKKRYIPFWEYPQNPIQRRKAKNPEKYSQPPVHI